MSSPKLLIPELSVSQAQKEVTVNTGVIRTVDVLVQATVIDKDLATPPGSPADGDTYIVAASPTGLWTGHAKDIAYYQSSAWVFHTPAGGWTVMVQDESLFYYYNGTAWALLGAGITGGTFTGLADTPSSLSGEGQKFVKVNTGGTALEFIAHEFEYDVSVFVSAKPGAAEVILRYKMPRAMSFPAALSGSQGIAGTAATASSVFSIRKNGSQFATATFAISGTVPTYSSGLAESFAVGDILTIIAPGSQDATLASINLVLKGTQG